MVSSPDRDKSEVAGHYLSQIAKRLDNIPRKLSSEVVFGGVFHVHFQSLHPIGTHIER